MITRVLKGEPGRRESPNKPFCGSADLAGAGKVDRRGGDDPWPPAGDPVSDMTVIDDHLPPKVRLGGFEVMLSGDPSAVAERDGCVTQEIDVVEYER